MNLSSSIAYQAVFRMLWSRGSRRGIPSFSDSNAVRAGRLLMCCGMAEIGALAIADLIAATLAEALLL
jgi:hypothetical protein